MTVSLVFIHIPKTAGTSVLHAITTAFGNNGILTVRPDHWADIKPEEFPDVRVESCVRVVAGHVTASQLWANPAIRRDNPLIFSVIRDPFERLLSVFNYAHATGRFAVGQRSAEAFEGYVKNAPQNRQCEFLDRPECLAEDLRQKHIICALPDVAEGLAAALRRFRVSAPIPTLNVTAKRTGWVLTKDAVPERVRNLCYELNARDLALFQSLSDINKRNCHSNKKTIGYFGCGKRSD